VIDTDSVFVSFEESVPTAKSKMTRPPRQQPHRGRRCRRPRALPAGNDAAWLARRCSTLRCRLPPVPKDGARSARRGTQPLDEARQRRLRAPLRARSCIFVGIIGSLFEEARIVRMHLGRLPIDPDERVAPRWPYDEADVTRSRHRPRDANTLVYAKGKGIVLNEPTVVALNTGPVSTGDRRGSLAHDRPNPGYIVAVRRCARGRSPTSTSPSG